MSANAGKENYLEITLSNFLYRVTKVRKVLWDSTVPKESQERKVHRVLLDQMEARVPPEHLVVRATEEPREISDLG